MQEEIISQYCLIIKNKLSCLRFDSAMVSIEKLIANFPDKSIGYYFKGLCEFAQRDHEAAVESYKKAIQLDAEFAKAYYNLGVCYFVMDYWDNALVCFGKALIIFTKTKELDKRQRCINAIKHIKSVE